METKITYVGTLNGFRGMWCGYKPNDVEVTEERVVLYPSEGYELKNIINKECFSSVWLKNGDTEDNYIEVEIKE